MYRCLHCDVELTEGVVANAHIIPNAIGGRLKTKRVLCQAHDSVLGHESEAELANDLLFLSNRLNIRRERGTPPTLQAERVKDGRIIDLNAGSNPSFGKPTVERNEVAAGTEVRVEARTTKEARQIVTGMKKKWPHLDVEAVLSTANSVREYVGTVKISTKIGGPVTLRAVAKIAILFLKDRAPDITCNISQVWNFVKIGGKIPYITHFYPLEEIFPQPAGEVRHSLLIFRVPDSNLLVGIVDLFNAATFAMILADDATEYIHEKYAFDLIRQTAIENPQVKVPSLSKEEWPQYFQQQKWDFARFRERLGRVIQLSQEREWESARAAILQRAVDATLGQLPDGIPLTRDVMNEFIQEFSADFSALLAANLDDSNDG